MCQLTSWAVHSQCYNIRIFLLSVVIKCKFAMPPLFAFEEPERPSDGFFGWQIFFSFSIDIYHAFPYVAVRQLLLQMKFSLIISHHCTVPSFDVTVSFCIPYVIIYHHRTPFHRNHHRKSISPLLFLLLQRCSEQNCKSLC